MAKRIKTVYRTDEIPHLWAHGLEEGREIRNARGNLYAIGDTIYSYGSHFPIAQRVARGGEVVYLFNPWRYSVTTSGHTRAARAAVPHGAEVYRLPPKDSEGRNLWDALARKDSRPIVDHYRGLIDSAARRAVAPRIRSVTRARILAEIGGIVDDWRKVRARFGLRCAADRVSAPANLEEMRAEVARKDKRIRAAEERARKVAAEVAAREEERAAERERLALPKVADWRRGEDIYLPQPGSEPAISIRSVRYPVLRIDGEEVETSKGARVTVDEARRFLGILPRLIERMGQESEERIGRYSRISATLDGLRIGCHLIPYSEVRAFCAFYGWPIPANLPERP
jgi:hypothetical protein